MPAAFEESLRFWPPINTWGRRVMRDVEMDGVEIPAGAQAAVLLGSGNRDPRKYSNPDSFLVERNPVDHLGFGYGTHSCAGQGLARMEAHAILSALARRNERLVFGELQRQPHNVVRGVDKLPVIDVVNACIPLECAIWNSITRTDQCHRRPKRCSAKSKPGWSFASSAHSPTTSWG